MKDYTCKGVVLYLDDVNSSFGDYYSGTEIAFENPVSVRNELGELIGYADLSIVGKTVEAEYRIPEEIIDGNVFPSITANEVLMKMDDYNWHVIYSKIEDIVLLNTPQPDIRILAL